MKYNIFVATPHSREFIEDRKKQINFPVVYITDNKEGLSVIYNRILKSREWSDDDRIILMHDDIWIHDSNWIEKLDDAHKDYDVVGLAGSGGNISKTDIAMWNLVGSRLSGTVTHTDGEKYWTNIYGPNGMTCKFIDGLFMSINPNKLITNNVYFDEEFTFHHYDFTFCVACHKAGLLVGTPKCPIFVVHEGLGELNGDFHESNMRVKSKYYST